MGTRHVIEISHDGHVMTERTLVHGDAPVSLYPPPGDMNVITLVVSLYPGEVVCDVRDRRNQERIGAALARELGIPTQVQQQEFCTVYNSYSPDFDQRVKDLMREGWRLHGSLAVVGGEDRFYFVQAMTRGVR